MIIIRKKRRKITRPILIIQNIISAPKCEKGDETNPYCTFEK